MTIVNQSVNVLVNGRKVQEYLHNGMTFIEARDGSEFEIDIKNYGGDRILAIISVDGINVVSGELATPDSSGYIISPYGNETIRGWRKSSSEVGAFKFTIGTKSYATTKNNGENNGIISVKLIREKYPVATWNKILEYEFIHYENPTWVSVPYPIYKTSDNTISADSENLTVNYTSCCCEPHNFDLGTTWGSKKNSCVTESEFEKGIEISTFNIYYASKEGLKQMGINFSKASHVHIPQGFKRKYAEPPKGWN